MEAIIDQEYTTAPLQRPDITTDLKQWISRPYKILVTSLDLSSGVNNNYPMQPQVLTDIQAPVFQLDFPSVLMGVPGIRQKINNHRFGRFSVKVKLTINATPYSQGSLLLVYSPLESTVAGTSRSLRTCGAPSLTSYPGIIMDINQTTSAEITLPFNTYKDYYDLISSEDMNSISLYCYVMTQLSDANIASFTLSVWATICDLELAGYTPLDVWAPSEGPTPPDFDPGVDTPPNEQYPTAPSAIHAQLQVNGRNTGAPPQRGTGTTSTFPQTSSGKTEGEAASGVLSGIARGVATIATSFSSFPLLSSYAKPVAWVADLAAKGFSAVGLSKPNTEMALRPVANIPTFGNTHGVGAFNGVKLGISQENALEGPSDAFMTDMDEMDIQYICAQPGVISNVFFQSILEPGEVLQTIPVTATFVPNTFNAYHAKHLTLMEFVSTNFAFWSGTIVYTFKIMKTPFHNGKLVITYNPHYNGITDEFSENYQHHVYFDIAERDCVQIRIPMLYNQSWLPTNSGFPNIDTNSVYLSPMSYSIGNIQIKVVNPLVGPDTVSSTVNMLVWKHGEDMEFAVPNRSLYPVLNMGSTPPDSTVFNRWTDFGGYENPYSIPIPPTIEASLQVNLSNTIQDPFTVTFNADTNDIKKKLTMCIGERIASLRTMCHQLTPDQYISVVTDPSAWHFYAHDDFRNPCDSGAATDWNSETMTASFSQLTYLSNIYRYWRGGMHIQIEPCSGPIRTIMTSPAVTNSITQTGNISALETTTTAPAHSTSVNQNPYHLATIPFYSTAMRIPIVRNYAQESNFPRLFNATTHFRMDYTAPVSAGSSDIPPRVRFNKGGDDDFSFGFLIGPSPIVVPNLSNPGGPA